MRRSVRDLEAPRSSTRGTSNRGTSSRAEREEGVQVAGEDEDEESTRCPPKASLAVAGAQIGLITLYYSIVIPTSRQYSESLSAPRGFSGIVVGSTCLAAFVVGPLYRPLCRKSFAFALYAQVTFMLIGSILYSLAKLAKSSWLLLSSRIIGGFGGQGESSASSSHSSPSASTRFTDTSSRPLIPLAPHFPHFQAQATPCSSFSRKLLERSGGAASYSTPSASHARSAIRSAPSSHRF